MNERKVAFVSGASRGIGRGIAIALAKEDFIVVGNARKYDPKNERIGLFEVKKTIESDGGQFLPVKGDIADGRDRERMVRETLEQYGKIDILVNNAGVAPKNRLDILQTNEESFKQVFSVNAEGPFFFTQAVAKQMIQQLDQDTTFKGCIIFISSISAYISSPSRAEYCISKAAVSHMARIYAHRLSEYGINVYEVRPGIIKTDMTSEVSEKYDKLIANGLILQNRWGYPEDVAKAVVALAKGYFPYSTGMPVEVSGGMNIYRL
jgi:3-oxoacyl-[acyl-carrier protein] reductase